MENMLIRPFERHEAIEKELGEGTISTSNSSSIPAGFDTESNPETFGPHLIDSPFDLIHPAGQINCFENDVVTSVLQTSSHGSGDPFTESSSMVSIRPTDLAPWIGIVTSWRIRIHLGRSTSFQVKDRPPNRGVELKPGPSKTFIFSHLPYHRFPIRMKRKVRPRRGNHGFRNLLTCRTRVNKRPVVEGNNKFGQNGTLKCQPCRKRHRQVQFSNPTAFF